MKKTNAMRILDSSKLEYEIKEYLEKDGISGLEVANNLNEDPNTVFKTLVTYGKDENYVFAVPVVSELDLKKAAVSSKEKKIEMLPQKELFKKTGYVHGGCSPIGMKKQFQTFIDKSALDREYIYISGGKIGMQIKIKSQELAELIDAKFVDITKES